MSANHHLTKERFPYDLEMKTREQNGCSVTSTSEAPLDASDNIEFCREMLRMGKEENVLNLIDCLNIEASLQ